MSYSMLTEKVYVYNLLIESCVPLCPLTNKTLCAVTRNENSIVHMCSYVDICSLIKCTDLPLLFGYGKR